MKNLTAILLLLASLTGNAQTKKTQTETKPANPVYFIDSVKINAGEPYLNYINPNDIASLNINRDPIYPNGAVFITLKDHNTFTKLRQDKLLSLNDIAKTNIPATDKRKPVLYLLDDKLLTDTAGVRIPFTFVKKVTIIKAAETPYFKTALPNVLLMMITTKPEELRIRGLAAAK
jgi:hypothetical protein